MKQQCKFLWVALTCEEALAVYTVVLFCLYLAIVMSGCASRSEGSFLAGAVKYEETRRAKP